MERALSSFAACCATPAGAIASSKTLRAGRAPNATTLVRPSTRVGDVFRVLRRKNTSSQRLSYCSAGLILPNGNGFEEPQSGGAKPVYPEDAAYETAGLSLQQMQVMGLTGQQDWRRSEPTEESISARASYADEMPSERNPPRRMATTMSAGFGGPAAAAPPDLPSLLLNSRIVYIGMPLVPAVTELVIAELLFLNYDTPEKDAYVYIHSTGSQSTEGEVVGFETEAYAILDTMNYIRPRIQTVCLGKAYGNAAMLLAAGAKGCRYATQNAQIMTTPPRLNRAFDTTTNVQIKANEIDHHQTTYVDYMTKFTGGESEKLQKELGRTRFYSPQQAIEYGLIDKIVPRQGKGNIMESKDYEQIMLQQQAQQQRYEQQVQGGGRPQ